MSNRLVYTMANVKSFGCIYNASRLTTRKQKYAKPQCSKIAVKLGPLSYHETYWVYGASLMFQTDWHSVDVFHIW